MTIKEKLFYKQRPYIYALLGIFAFAFAKKSKLALISGVILLVCSYIVFEMRRRYQEKQIILKSKEKTLAKSSEIQTK